MAAQVEASGINRGGRVSGWVDVVKVVCSRAYQASEPHGDHHGIIRRSFRALGTRVAGNTGISGRWRFLDSLGMTVRRLGMTVPAPYTELQSALIGERALGAWHIIGSA